MPQAVKQLPELAWSKALNKAQSNWSATEHEGYAIMFFLNKWRHLLLGVDVEVLSDHHALQWLFDQQDPIGKIVQWITKVQEFFPLWIMHQAGQIHTNGNTLLRKLIARNNVEEETPTVVAAVQTNKFKQNKSTLLSNPNFEWIIKAIKGNDHTMRGKTTQQLALLNQVMIDSINVYQTYWPTKSQGKLTGASVQLQWIMLQGL